MLKSTLFTTSFLGFLLLTSCDKAVPAASDPAAASAGLKIAYVEGDTVLMNFNAFRAASDKLDARQRELETELQKKGAALEKEIMGYQQQAQSGSLTPKEMQAREKYLAGRQESLMAERDRLAKMMMDESAVINEQLKKILEDKLDVIKTREGYDFILSKAEGGPILLADKKYDITQEVLKLLNEEAETISVDTSAGK